MPYHHSDQKRMVKPALNILKLGMTKVQEYVLQHSVSTVNLAVLQQMIRDCDSLAQSIYGPFTSAYTLQSKTGSVVDILTQSKMISMAEAVKLRKEFQETMTYENSNHGWRFTFGPWKSISRRAYRELFLKENYWGKDATLPMSLHYALSGIDFTDDTLYCEEGVQMIHHLHVIIEGLMENHLNPTTHYRNNAVHIVSTDRRLGRLVELGYLSDADALVLDTLTNPSANRVSWWDRKKGQIMEPKVLFTEVFESLDSNADRGLALSVICEFVRQYDRTVSVDFTALSEVIRAGVDRNMPFSLLRPMISESTGIFNDPDVLRGITTSKVTSYWQEISVAAADRQDEIDSVYQFKWRKTGK